MANIIDAFVLELGLDTTKFTANAAQATAALNALKTAASSTAQTVQTGAQATAASLQGVGTATTQTANTVKNNTQNINKNLGQTGQQLKALRLSYETEGRTMGEAISSVQDKLLGLAGAYFSLDFIKNKSIGYATEITNLVNTASAVGLNTQEVSAYGAAVAHMGGDMEAAQQQMAAFATNMAALKFHPESLSPEMAQAMGRIGASPLSDSWQQILDKLADYADQHRGEKDWKANFSALSGMLGITDPGTITLLEQGRKQYDSLVALEQKNIALTDTQRQKVVELKQAYVDMGIAGTTAFERILAAASPTISGILKSITGFFQHKENDPLWAGPGLGATVGGVIGGILGIPGGIPGMFVGASAGAAWGGTFGLGAGVAYGEYERATEGTSSSNLTSSSSPLLNLAALIRGGEGSYNSVNLGGAGGYANSTRNLQDMTVSQVETLQSSRDFNAAGAYQFTRPVLMATAQAMGLSGDEKFSKELQDKMFQYTVLNKPMRQNLGKYLTGQSTDIHAALVDLSREFASVANPDTGRSTYEGIGGNHASISVDQATRVLEETRAANVSALHDNTAALLRGTLRPPDNGIFSTPSSTSHVSSSTTIGTIVVHTQATDATGIASDIRKAMASNATANQFNTGLVP